MSVKRLGEMGAAAIAAVLLLLAVGSGRAQADNGFSNPILPGDHPDPTIIRVGTTYWTTSTAGNWAPQFALYRSDDLKHWSAAGFVFPHTPAWATGNFWAPELVAERHRILVYYVARKRGGPLCVAAATASRPDGRYKDHGPIVCEEDGSIDPAFVRDEAGKPYLVWKEDGNSRGQLTRIWAQRLGRNLLHLKGKKTQLLVNQPDSWEGGVVEAPYVLRHDGSFYMFYAGNGCCGVGCRYAEGVARADHLLGPWQRDPANPIIAANAAWRCPGHGTAVETPAGDDLFLYHAYPVGSLAYLGRESVLDKITWRQDGWPEINAGSGPGVAVSDTSLDVTDDFAGPVLDSGWRWPVGQEPIVHVASGKLVLTLRDSTQQSFVARSLLWTTYTASVGVLPGNAAGGGLGLIGDASDDLVLSREAGGLELWRADRAVRHSLWKQPLKTEGTVWLRVTSAGDGHAQFSYMSGDSGWTNAGDSVAMQGLLPWDSGLRVGLVADGESGGDARFVNFSVSGR